ncbi:MAG: hypothetical protein EA392_14015 [Cryomorphaceae bacterium]|nr:MAG: hypothetical protein EA392_14015 [Cryomorphaceae bacterium]
MKSWGLWDEHTIFVNIIRLFTSFRVTSWFKERVLHTFRAVRMSMPGMHWMQVSVTLSDKRRVFFYIFEAYILKC